MRMTACPKIKNYRNPAYLKFIRSKPCINCGIGDTAQAHHESFKQSGMGTKGPDIWTLPLCAQCHGVRHQIGFESFWQSACLDIKLEMLKLINEFLSLNKGR